MASAKQKLLKICQRYGNIVLHTLNCCSEVSGTAENERGRRTGTHTSPLEIFFFVTFRSIRLVYAAQSHFALQYKTLFR